MQKIKERVGVWEEVQGKEVRARGSRNRGRARSNRRMNRGLWGRGRGMDMDRSLEEKTRIEA